MKNKHILEEMIQIFGKQKFDWMGYKITPQNYISYHHILEKRNGGKETVDNGAILSKDSHILLHKLEQINYDLYLHWQLLFININEKKAPLDDDSLWEIEVLLKETKDFFVSLKDDRVLSLIRKLPQELE